MKGKEKRTFLLSSLSARPVYSLLPVSTKSTLKITNLKFRGGDSKIGCFYSEGGGAKAQKRAAVSLSPSDELVGARQT